MKCKWYAVFEGVCTNGECPYRGDTCPTSEHPEICKHAEEAPEIPRLNENCLKYKRGCICLKCKYDYCECCIAVDECPIYTCPHFMEEESHE